MESFCFEFPLFLSSNPPARQCMCISFTLKRWDDDDFILPAFPVFAKTHTHMVYLLKPLIRVERIIGNTEQWRFSVAETLFSTSSSNVRWTNNKLWLFYSLFASLLKKSTHCLDLLWQHSMHFCVPADFLLPSCVSVWPCVRLLIAWHFAVCMCASVPSGSLFLS